MNQILVKRVRKITSLIIVSSIFGLCLLSLLPLISIKSNSADNAEYLNLDAMEKSDDEQIYNLANSLRLINTCFWIVIIIGLFSLIGIIINISEKKQSLARIIILIGCVTLIFNVLIIFYYLNLIDEIESLNNIITSSMFGPILYAHLPIIMGIISLGGSIAYTKVVTSYYIQHILNQRKQVKPKKTKKIDKKKQEKQYSEEKKLPTIEEKSEEDEILKQIRAAPLEPVKKTPTKKLVVLNEPPVLKNDHIREFSKTETPKPQLISEKIASNKKSPEKISVAEEKISKPEIKPKSIKEPSIEKKEPIPPSPSFEEALTAAVEKKKAEKTQIIKDDVNNELKQPYEKKHSIKKLKVKCPECNNIFTINKEGDIKKIECPICGKKGITK